MIEDIRAAIPLGFFLSFMIGPVFFVLLETGATKGFRAALALDFGVIFGDCVFLCIAYFSSFQLLEDLSNQPGLYVFGGAILVVYGITVFSRKNVALKEQRVSTARTNYLALFFKGFLLNIINIGVLVFWLGMIIVIGPSLDNDPDRMLTFFIAMLAVYLIIDIFKILLAKQLKRKLTSERIRMIKKILGVVLIICGIFLMVKGFLPKDRFNLENGIERIESM